MLAVAPGRVGTIGEEAGAQRQPSAFYPTDLGASLLGLWDAENAASLTLASGAVASWADLVAGYALAQGTTILRPTYGATSFNGRPGVTFDGSSTFLTLASVPFPTGSTACEIWTLCDQTMLAANTNAGVLFSYGDETIAERDIRRRVVSGVNRATTGVGNGSALVQDSNTSVDFSGRSITRSTISPTTTTTYANNVASAGASVVPGTGTARVRMGATAGAGAGNFWGGVMNMVLVTALLTTQQASDLYAFLLARRG